MSLYPKVGTFLSSVRGTSNSSVSHLSSHFTAEDTEAQREQSPACGHRVGTWRKSARTWSFLWPHCSCHCPPGMEATPAPTIGSPFSPLYKALVPRKLYINHHFLPALARFVCGWDMVCVWDGLDSGLVFKLMQCFIQYLFSESSRGPGQCRDPDVSRNQPRPLRIPGPEGRRRRPQRAPVREDTRSNACGVGVACGSPQTVPEPA